MTKIHREGALGALMDEYERAADELKNVIRLINPNNYAAIIDFKTSDPNCRSIQTIMNHVVKAGYGYANLIRKSFTDPWTERNENYEVDSPESACKELANMFAYTVETLQNKFNLSSDVLIKEIVTTKEGQRYDLEQILEHAIVHILRHRRQIENFLINDTTK